MERDKVNNDLRYHEIFGQIPPRFCAEVKAIIYNECLSAAECMKDKLLKVDSTKSEEIYSNLTCFLSEIDNELDGHVEELQEFLYKNYVPEPSIPLHREGVAESVGATERLNQLRMKLKATVQLNTQLTEKINLLKEEIVKRQEILKKLKEQKNKLKELQKAKEIVLQMDTQCKKVATDF